MRKLFALATIIVGLVAAPVLAGELPAPTGDVILTVTGAIENFTSEGKAEFDLAGLEALETRETTTSNPWYEGPQRFTGPLGSVFLDVVGAKGTMLKITALNDFVAEVPVEDLRKYPLILATRHNGEEISVREKGPIFLIYPFDEFPELQNQQMYSRSAWQIKSIEVY